MRVQVRLRGVNRSPSIIEYATRRVHQHLSRFGSQVAGVTVRISDLNGPRGGEDKRCQVTACGPRLGSVNLTEINEDIFAGIDLGLDKLSHLIGRRIDRARSPQAAVEAWRAT